MNILSVHANVASRIAPALLLAWIILFLSDSIPYQKPIRDLSFDFYQRLLPRERLSAPVTIVDIDEASLKQFGQWPWPRSLLAKLVEKIGGMGPAAVAIDIIMPEPDRSTPCTVTRYIPNVPQSLVDQVCRLPSNDTLLANAFRSTSVVLGVAGIENGDTSNIKAAPMRTIGEDPRAKMLHFPTALLNVSELEDAAKGHAILSAEMESGVVRRVPLVARVGETVIPSLALEILRLAVDTPFFNVTASSKGIEGVGVGELFIPTQPDGTTWIHYSRHDPARFISAANLLNGTAKTEDFQRKLVLVGFSGLGLIDFPTTALGERVPGVEIHAQLLESIFDSDLLRRPAWMQWLEALIMLALGLFVLFGISGLKARLQVPMAITISLLLCAAGFTLYANAGLLLDVASPLILFAVFFAFMLASSLIREESQIAVLEDDLRFQREEAAKVRGEMEAAKRFQMGIVPNAVATFAQEPRLEIVAKMEPAKMVGGDLYDCFFLDDNRVFFTLGDVCGKGVPASLFMVISKTLFKSIALRGTSDDIDLGALVSQANREICRDNPEQLFVTLFAGILDLRNGELVYCNAGHELPLLIAPKCHPAELKGKSGPPVSTMDGFEYKTFRYRMASEEFLCIFSDGITEANNLSQELFGHERLEGLLENITASLDSVGVLDLVCGAVRDFTNGTEPADDLTIMIIRWRPSAE